MSQIQQQLQEWSQNTPQFLWLGEGATGDWVTVADAARLVRHYVAMLTDFGVEPGQRVLLGVSRPIRFALLWLALLDLGAVAVPVDSSAPTSERIRIAGQISVSWMVADESTAGETAPGVGVVMVDGKGRLSLLRSDLQTGDRYTSGGVVLFTSGSTGEPKPVGLPLAALCQAAKRVAVSHHLGPNDRGYCPLPLFHVNAEVVGVLSSLAARSSLILDLRMMRHRFWQNMKEWKITWINLVPTLLTLLIKDSGYLPFRSERVRFLRTASASLPTSVKIAAENMFDIEVVQSYGISEACGPVTVNTAGKEKPHSVGVPDGVEITLLMGGEIGIRGPQVIDPAWGPNEWAQSRYFDGWYRTGDLGHCDPDGYLYIDGRVKDVINRGGEKIFPAEVESVLLAHPAVYECAVVGRPNPVLGEEVVAFLVTNNLNTIEPELRSLVASQLSPYKAPTVYMAVNQLPRNRSGKILRHQLLPRSTQPA